MAADRDPIRGGSMDAAIPPRLTAEEVHLASCYVARWAREADHPGWPAIAREYLHALGLPGTVEEHQAWLVEVEYRRRQAERHNPSTPRLPRRPRVTTTKN